MIEESIFQKDLTILKIFSSSINKVAKYLWQKLTELRRELKTMSFIKTKFKIFSLPYFHAYKSNSQILGSQQIPLVSEYYTYPLVHCPNWLSMNYILDISAEVLTLERVKFSTASLGIG